MSNVRLIKKRKVMIQKRKGFVESLPTGKDPAILTADSEAMVR